MSPLAEFLKTEAGGGVLLLAATIIALIWANSPWSEFYNDLWHTRARLGFGDWAITEDLQHWVNDALMVVFFFMIGLEIKREFVTGELRNARAAALPALAAFGGMVVPAGLFLLVVAGGEGRDGWAIPMATDIAFAIGVLAVLGSRIPSGVKVFLLTLAIVDDIGAITVIAVFYSDGVSVVWLAAAAGALGLVIGARRVGITRPLAYLPMGAIAWYSTYRAGVHPTISGVALGLLTPATPVGGRAVLQELEHRLHPISSYVIVPIFALANAGVALDMQALGRAASSRLTWAVAAGLVIGKTVGITTATLTGQRAGIGRLPTGVDTRDVMGIGALGGIGFTVALFIASMAFDSIAAEADAKIGILAGSLLSGLLGAGLLVTSRSVPERSKGLSAHTGG